MTVDTQARVVPGTERVVRWAAIAAWVLAAVLLVATLLLVLATPGQDPSSSSDIVFVPLLVAMGTTLATVGALLAIRLPRNPIGWLMLGAGLLEAATFAAASYMSWVVASGDPGDIPAWVIVIPTLCFQSGLVLAGIVVLVFPSGQLPRFGAAILAVILAGLALGTGASLLRPGTTENGTSLPNPIGWDPIGPYARGLEVIGTVLLTVGLVLAAATLVGRFRSAVGDEREQLEWFMFTAVMLAAALVVASLQVGLVSDIAWVVSFAGFALLPVSVAIAITKYRLYDIDRLVNRTLVYVPLVAILGGVFAACIAFFQRLFLQVTGNQSDAGVVLTTLIVAGTFTPLKKSIETSVDRRFRTTPPMASTGGPTGPAEPMAPRWTSRHCSRIRNSWRGSSPSPAR